MLILMSKKRYISLRTDSAGTEIHTIYIYEKEVQATVVVQNSYDSLTSFYNIISNYIYIYIYFFKPVLKVPSAHGFTLKSCCKHVVLFGLNHGHI